MRTNTVKGADISALSLGTVQLGMDYGISNPDGKPGEEAAFAILDRAMALGINTLDTAGAYGQSEEVIGRWLKSVPAGKRPLVATKVKNLDHSSMEALRASLRAQAERSKARLGLEQLPALMLHSCDDYFGDEENVSRAFQELKEAGDIRFSGISAYSSHDYRKIAASGFDAVQVPVNIFDWGQLENGGMAALAASGMMVFVRSVYLQGLVFQRPETLPPHMSFAAETLEKFHGLCGKYGLTPARLALSYALSLPGVTSLVLGSEKTSQVEQNAALVEQAVTLTEEQMAEIRENFLHTPARVLDPSTWNQ